MSISWPREGFSFTYQSTLYVIGKRLCRRSLFFFVLLKIPLMTCQLICGASDLACGPSTFVSDDQKFESFAGKLRSFNSINKSLFTNDKRSNAIKQVYRHIRPSSQQALMFFRAFSLSFSSISSRLSLISRALTCVDVFIIMPSHSVTDFDWNLFGRKNSLPH